MLRNRLGKIFSQPAQRPGSDPQHGGNVLQWYLVEKHRLLPEKFFKAFFGGGMKMGKHPLLQQGEGLGQ